MKTIKTVWEKRVYDVWGNNDDGYYVNDSFSDGEITIRCKVEVCNVGTPREFTCAYPSDYQLKRIFGYTGAIDTDGDDTTIYVNIAKHYYPLGELHCISHESLSPIREAKNELS